MRMEKSIKETIDYTLTFYKSEETPEDKEILMTAVITECSGVIDEIKLANDYNEQLDLDDIGVDKKKWEAIALIAQSISTEGYKA